MNKMLKAILIVGAIIFVVIIVIPMLLGILSSVDPSGAAKQGQCVAQCREQYEQSDSRYNECTEQCVGPVDIQE